MDPGAYCRLDRPWRDGHLLLPHFPALRAGLLSLSPFGTTCAHPRLPEPITPMTNEQPRNTYVSSSCIGQQALAIRLTDDALRTQTPRSRPFIARNR
jgi:hypothetical protein